GWRGRGAYSSRLPRQLDDLARRGGGAGLGRDPGLGQHASPLFLTGPGHPDHQRHPETEVALRLDDPARDLVATGYPAEDVDQDAADPLVHRKQLERVVDHLRPGAATDVEEVRRPPSLSGHQVQRVHDQPGAVADDADPAVEADV